MKQDLIFALIISMILPILSLIIGDALYLGLWYYLLLPAVLFVICFFAKTNKYFLSGAAFGLFISLGIYFMINISLNEGLLGLGHLFSIPGAIVGVVAGVIINKKYSFKSSLSSFFLGLTSFSLGFCLNQAITCHKVIYCGYLSKIMGTIF